MLRDKFTGGETVNKETPLDIMPLYVKAGCILPIGPKVQYATEKKWDNLEIRIYEGANGEFTLYEDEGDNYNYEKGAYSTITFNWNNSKKTLTISGLEGTFTGILNGRTFNIIVVGNNKGNGAGLAEKYDKSVSYSGKKVIVNL